MFKINTLYKFYKTNLINELTKNKLLSIKLSSKTKFNLYINNIY